MKMNISTKNKALVASYSRSTLAGVLTLLMAGVTDVKVISYALFAGLAPVVLRALNPKDPAFGKAPEAVDVQAEIDAAVADAIKAERARVKSVAAKKVVATKPKTK